MSAQIEQQYYLLFLFRASDLVCLEKRMIEVTIIGRFFTMPPRLSLPIIKTDVQT
jgi:hypothetical protein